MINQKLCVELLGVGLPNRGAELMALTVMGKIREHFGDCIFCSSQRLPYSAKAGVDIYSCVENKSFKSIKGYLLRAIGVSGYALIGTAEKERLKYGVVLDTDVDMVLDISGFAYGDYWGVDKAEKRLASRIAKWKATATPLFILPQAFGPFETPGFKEALAPALAYAKLVCARDSVSAAHLKSLWADVKTYPDITFSLPVTDLFFPPALSYSVVIPNSKLLESHAVDKDSYYRMVGRYAEVSRAAGITPFALNHEGARDYALCLEIEKLFGIRMLNPADALLIKQIISGAKFVFSSRFHGAVSSIATDTPALVLGWSHKYQQLMAQFGIEELLIDCQAGLELALEVLTDDRKNAALSMRINAHRAQINGAIDKFWAEFFVRAEAALPVKKLNKLRGIQVGG